MRIESKVIMTRLFSQIFFIEEYQICEKIQSNHNQIAQNDELKRSWLLIHENKKFTPAIIQTQFVNLKFSH